MRLRVLGSGSKGNSLAVRSGGTLVLVDIGFSYRELTRRMALCGLKADDVSAVLFTHDHSDHCAGAATFRSRHPTVPFFANGDTADAIAGRCKVDDGWTVFENGIPFALGDFSVTAFSIPHDAADPVGYFLEGAGGAFFVGTDMGFVTANAREMFARATCALLEANHDPILLEQSGRPPLLKQRIRGRNGHLANEDAAALLRDTNPPCLRRLLLGHISSECNSVSLARSAFTETIAALNRSDIALDVLRQDAPSELFEF